MRRPDHPLSPASVPRRLSLPSRHCTSTRHRPGTLGADRPSPDVVGLNRRGEIGCRRLLDGGNRAPLDHRRSQSVNREEEGVVQ